MYSFESIFYKCRNSVIIFQNSRIKMLYPMPQCLVKTVALFRKIMQYFFAVLTKIIYVFQLVKWLILP